MLALLAEWALRSSLLGCLTWLGLALARVRNPQVHMTAWTVVLLVSMAMPVLTPWMKVEIPDAEPPVRLAKIAWTNVPSIVPAAPAPKERALASRPPLNAAPVAPASGNDWRLLITGIYLFASGVMLLRLLIGLMLMRRVCAAARRVREDWTAGADILLSDVVAVPVTFASAILLPSASSAWNARKLRAVLLHEGSHVARGDFYVLLLAAIHRALFWFSPFAWWLEARLADLAEWVSDDAAISGLKDRRSYANILLDVASSTQDLPSGLPMARPSTIRHRVERILAAAPLPESLCWRKRLLIGAALAPLAALSAGTIVPSAAPAAPDLTTPAAGEPAGLSPAQLDRYAGQFQISVVAVLTVTRDGERLFAQMTGRPRLALSATAEREFVTESGDARITFVEKGDGPVDEIIWRKPDARPRHAPRIDLAMAREIEAAFQRRIAAAPDRFRDQIPIPGSKEALGETIEDLRRGTPGYPGMSPQLAGKIRQLLPYLQDSLVRLGAVESIYFRGVGPGSYDIYGVKFANGLAEFRIDLAASGMVEDVSFRPDGDGTLGGIPACSLEPDLKSTRDTAPIQLSLENRSGAGVRLFWVDGLGGRLSHGTLANGESTDMETAIGQPLIIADQAGQCREIILPGQLTRFHAIEPLQPSSPPGPSAMQRTAPIPGSDEVLQRHIDGIRRGAPDYGRMAPGLAATTRKQLFWQQAILARLGVLRAMSFRGVSQAGNDVYTVHFANGPAEWQIGLANDGRIENIVLGPQY